MNEKKSLKREPIAIDVVVIYNIATLGTWYKSLCWLIVAGRGSMAAPSSWVMNQYELEDSSKMQKYGGNERNSHRTMLNKLLKKGLRHKRLHP